MVGLDPEGALELRRLLRRLAGEGVTIFLSTHSLAVAEELCAPDRHPRPGPAGGARHAGRAARPRAGRRGNGGRSEARRRSRRSSSRSSAQHRRDGGVAPLLVPRLARRHATSRRRRAAHAPSAHAGCWSPLFWAGVLLRCSRACSGYFHGLADFGPLADAAAPRPALREPSRRAAGVATPSPRSPPSISPTTSPRSWPRPSRHRRLHHARFVETLCRRRGWCWWSACPRCLAYGVVYQAGPLFYAGALAVLVPFLVIPAALGVLRRRPLWSCLPGARRARRAAGRYGAAPRRRGARRPAAPPRAAGASLGPRRLRRLPRRLRRRPARPGCRRTWAAEVLMPLLGARSGEPLFYLGLLASTAAMLFLVSAAVVERGLPARRGRARRRAGQRVAAGGSPAGALARAPRPAAAAASRACCSRRTSRSSCATRASGRSSSCSSRSSASTSTISPPCRSATTSPLALAMRDLAALLQPGARRVRHDGGRGALRLSDGEPRRPRLVDPPHARRWRSRASGGRSSGSDSSRCSGFPRALVVATNAHARRGSPASPRSSSLTLVPLVASES